MVDLGLTVYSSSQPSKEKFALILNEHFSGLQAPRIALYAQILVKFFQMRHCYSSDMNNRQGTIYYLLMTCTPLHFYSQ